MPHPALFARAVWFSELAPTTHASSFEACAGSKLHSRLFVEQLLGLRQFERAAFRPAPLQNCSRVFL